MGRHSSRSQKKRKISNKESRIPETTYTLVSKGGKATCLENLTPQKVKGTRRFVDVCGGHLITKLQGHLPVEDYKPVLDFMLDNTNCIGNTELSRRGLGCSSHLGCWTTRGGKYYKYPRPTKETIEGGDLAHTLMKLALPIARKAGEAVRLMFPHMATNLCTVPKEFRPFDLWPLMVANFLSPQKAHKDYEDYAGGFCVLVPLGIFNGGELFFKELNLTIPVQNGDLIFFRSDLLTHEVLEFEGLRMSLIFTTHQRFMKWVKRDFSEEAQKPLESLEDIVDYVVQWGQQLKAKTVPLDIESNSNDEPEISFPRVQGHNPNSNTNDCYERLEIPAELLTVRRQRQQAQEEDPC